MLKLLCVELYVYLIDDVECFNGFGLVIVNLLWLLEDELCDLLFWLVEVMV